MELVAMYGPKSWSVIAQVKGRGEGRKSEKPRSRESPSAQLQGPRPPFFFSLSPSPAAPRLTRFPLDFLCSSS